jgi:hypothetical protein
MPPDDDWSQYLKKPAPASPSSGDDDWSQFTKQPASPSLGGEILTGGEDFAKGVGKGALGDVVGLGQVAERGLDAVSGGGGSAAVKRGLDAIVPGTSSALHDVKEITTAPSSGFMEGAGNVVGGALPFAFAPEAALGSLARRAAWGGLSGMAQPTESGSALSHLAGGAAGAAGGAALSPQLAEKATRIAQASGIMAAGEWVARQIGVSPWMAMEMMGVPAWLMFRRPTPISRAVGRAVGQIPAGLASAGAGAAGGQAASAAEQNVGQ